MFSTRSVPVSLMVFGLGLVGFAAAPAAADWLVTTQGQTIETDGSWIIDDDLVAYIDLDGELRTLPLAEVDLKGSQEATERQRDRAHASGTAREPAEEKTPLAAEEADDDEPRITVYMTSWCGYCRKAQKLLRSLGADFVSKDIEKDRVAALEFRRKGRGGGGVPLIDFDGQVVRGYKEQSIRYLVRKLQSKEAD